MMLLFKKQIFILQMKFIDNVEIRRESRVRNKTRLLKVIRGVSEEGGLIIHTFVSKAMRSLLISECAKLGISTIDLIGRTMDALTQFFHMGGYAFYVWTAYAITTVLLVLNVYIPIRQAKSQQRRLRRMLSGPDVRAQN